MSDRAPLPDRRRVARTRPHRGRRRPARRGPRGPGGDRRRPAAAAGRLRPRRPHEDRDRHGRGPLRRPPRPDPGQPGRPSRAQPGPRELAGRDVPRPAPDAARERRRLRVPAARATPTSRAPSSTSPTTCATCSSGPAPARRPCGWPREPSRGCSSRRRDVEVRSHVAPHRPSAALPPVRRGRGRPSTRSRRAPCAARTRGGRGDDRRDRPGEEERRHGGRRRSRWWPAGVPAGLGSFAQWDRRSTGGLAQALMSIPAVKAVAIGEGFAARRDAGLRASTTRSCSTTTRGSTARRNRAGGLEGGVTNGEELRAQAVVKPIPTLLIPLRSIDLADEGAAEGVGRAERHLRRARGRGRGRGHDRLRPRRRPPREVRGRLARPSSSTTSRRPGPRQRARWPVAEAPAHGIRAHNPGRHGRSDPSSSSATPSCTPPPRPWSTIDDAIARPRRRHDRDDVRGPRHRPRRAPDRRAAAGDRDRPLGGRGPEAGHQARRTPSSWSARASRGTRRAASPSPATAAPPSGRPGSPCKGLDPEGKERIYNATDLLARAFCHEIDHIDGLLFVDRLSPLKRDLLRRKLRKKRPGGTGRSSCRAHRLPRQRELRHPLLRGAPRRGPRRRRRSSPSPTARRAAARPLAPPPLEAGGRAPRRPRAPAPPRPRARGPGGAPAARARAPGRGGLRPDPAPQRHRHRAAGDRERPRLAPAAAAGARRPIQWAIANGETETGRHHDAHRRGPRHRSDPPRPLARRSAPSETAAELEPRLARLGAEVLLETVRGLDAGTLAPGAPGPRPGHPRPASSKKEDGRHRLGAPGARPSPAACAASTPGRAPSPSFDGRLLKVLRVREEPGAGPRPSRGPSWPWTARASSSAAAAGTRLRLVEVQPESRRAMPAAAFAAGRPVCARARGSAERVPASARALALEILAELDGRRRHPRRAPGPAGRGGPRPARAGLPARAGPGHAAPPRRARPRPRRGSRPAPRTPDARASSTPCASAPTSSSTSACPRTPRCPSRSSSRGGSSPARRGFVNAVLRRLAREGPPPEPDADADPLGWLTTAGSLPRWLAERWLRAPRRRSRRSPARAPSSTAPPTAFRLNPRVADALAQARGGRRRAAARRPCRAPARPSGRTPRSRSPSAASSTSRTRARSSSPTSPRATASCSTPAPRPAARRSLIADLGGPRSARGRRRGPRPRRLAHARPPRLALGRRRTSAWWPPTPSALRSPAPSTPCCSTPPAAASARWPATPTSAGALRARGPRRGTPQRQRALLESLAPLVRPGGRLVYATCSVEPEENEGVVAAVPRRAPGVRARGPAPAGPSPFADRRFVRIAPGSDTAATPSSPATASAAPALDEPARPSVGMW